MFSMFCAGQNLIRGSAYKQTRLDFEDNTYISHDGRRYLLVRKPGCWIVTSIVVRSCGFTGMTRCGSCLNQDNATNLASPVLHGSVVQGATDSLPIIGLLAHDCRFVSNGASLIGKVKCRDQQKQFENRIKAQIWDCV
jgi:hypothetical protein